MIRLAAFLWYGNSFIIILSDMMNWSDRLKMEPGSSQFTEKSLPAALKNVPAVEMPNAKVLVLTAAIPSNVTQKHFELVKSF